MRIKYLFILLSLGISLVFFKPFWLKFKFGCELVDYGAAYLVFLKCENNNGVDFGVADYKFSNGKLFVKRYVIYDYDMRFYYCPKVELYVYDGKNKQKYDEITAVDIIKSYTLGNNFLSIDEEYLKYADIDRNKCDK